MTELTAAAEATRIRPDGTAAPETHSLAREHRMTLMVDGSPCAQFVCTRSHLRQLVLGRLCTAGFITEPEDVLSLSFSGTEDRAEVRLRPGAGGNQMLPLTDRSGWRSEDVFRLAATLAASMPLHDETMGTHGSALLHRGQVLCCCEDIGRHNAIDKAVGTALAQGVPLCECVLYTTGRVAVDIAEKAVTAGIPVLVSRTLPTSEALDLAKARGLTLIGRAWATQYEVFTKTDGFPTYEND